MTLAQMEAYKGRWTMRQDVLSIAVDVLDVRQVFDRVDVLVTPVAGSGKAWIAASRLSERA